MLYALSLEPLLSRIRVSIDGLILPGFNSNIVLSAYADDLVVLIKTQDDVDILTNLTVKYKNLSAAKINWDKSEAIAVGNWPNGLPTLPQNLAWKREGLKYLGVFLGNKAMEKRTVREYRTRFVVKSRGGSGYCHRCHIEAESWF